MQNTCFADVVDGHIVISDKDAANTSDDKSCK